MIDGLRAAGAGVIAYDFEFRESTPDDAALRTAIESAGPQLLLAATQIDGEGQGQILGGPGGELPASVGYAGFPLAADDAYRQVDESVGLPGAAQRLESFAVVAAGLAGAPLERFERAWIDYHGPAGTFKTYRFADVLGGADSSRFLNKIVVVGTSARQQNDLHATAHGGRRVMSGAEIQANAISTLRREQPLRSLGAAAELAVIVCLGLLPAILLIIVRPKLAAGLIVLAAVVYLALAQVLFSAGWVLPVAIPLLALLLSAIGVVGVRRAVTRPSRLTGAA
jgi:CHASE2 domain-containing sensor protein